MKKVLFVLFMASFLVGCSSNEEAQAEVDGEVMNLEEIKENISESEEKFKALEEKISSKESELSDLESSFSERKAEFDELTKLADNRDSIEEEISKSESTLESLNSDISETESKLDELKEEIVSFADEPIKLEAGYFYFGEDIESNRYKLTAQEGQRGNVFIRSAADGMSYVSDTFGDGTNRSVEEFTFTASDGDEIEATIPIYLYPVE